MTIRAFTLNSTCVNAVEDFLVTTGVEDCALEQPNPTTNVGSNPTAEISKFDGTSHSYVLFRFNISTIPASQAISDAKLWLYQSPAASGTGYALRANAVIRPWNVSQATWNVYTTGNSWTTAGALSNGNDINTTYTGVSATIGSTTGQYYAVDVTAIVAAAYAGTLSQCSFHVQRDDAGNDGLYKLFSMSDADDGQRPELVVTYAAAGGGLRRKGSLGLLGVGR